MLVEIVVLIAKIIAVEEVKIFSLMNYLIILLNLFKG